MDESRKHSEFKTIAEPALSGVPASPVMVIRLTVRSGQAMSWRIGGDSELRVGNTRVWVTRLFSPYDHWLQSGDVLRLKRGERIWLSVDGDVAAHVSLTSAYPLKRHAFARCSDWISDFLADLSFLRN